MSTRSSLAYTQSGDTTVHLYHEMLDPNAAVHLEIALERKVNVVNYLIPAPFVDGLAKVLRRAETLPDGVREVTLTRSVLPVHTGRHVVLDPSAICSQCGGDRGNAGGASCEHCHGTGKEPPPVSSSRILADPDHAVGAFYADLEPFLEKHAALTHDGDSPIERMLLLLAHVIDRERQAQTDALIGSCLDGAVEAIRHAAVDYYASWK